MVVGGRAGCGRGGRVRSLGGGLGAVVRLSVRLWLLFWGVLEAQGRSGCTTLYPLVGSHEASEGVQALMTQWGNWVRVHKNFANEVGVQGQGSG